MPCKCFDTLLYETKEFFQNQGEDIEKVELDGIETTYSLEDLTSNYAFRVRVKRNGVKSGKLYPVEINYCPLCGKKVKEN